MSTTNDPFTTVETTEDGTETVKLTPMDPEAKELWIEALRSDRFHQARGVFFERGIAAQVAPKHCCLAVLTDVYVEAGGTLVRRREEPNGQLIGYDVFMVWRQADDLRRSSWEPGTAEELATAEDRREIHVTQELVRIEPEPGDYMWMRLASDLPMAVVEWAGLASANPVLDPTIECGMAINLNDAEGLSYSEIADRIEQYL